MRTAGRTWRRLAALGLALAVAALIAAPAGAQQSVSITSTDPSPLTEANLHGAELIVTLNGVTFTTNPEDPVRDGGIGLETEPMNSYITISSVEGIASGSNQATLTLRFADDGDISAASQELRVRVNAGLYGGNPNLSSTSGPVTVAPSDKATITSPNPAALAEEDLDGAELTVALTHTTFASSAAASDFKLEPEIPGLDVSGVAVAAGGREATLTLAFTDDGDIADDATVAVTVLRAAHAGSGDLPAGTVTVTAAPPAAPPAAVTPDPPNAAIASTTPSKLAEANLDGAELTVTLTHATFASGVSASGFELVTAIPGLTISRVSGVTADEATLILAFTGDAAARGTVAVKVLAAAHDGDGDLITGTVAVAPSSAAAITSTDPAALTEANLDGATLTITLTGATFASGVAASHFTLVTEVPGVSVDRVSGAAAGGRAATLTLAFSGDVSTDETLAVTVAAEAHGGGGDLTTGTVAVAAVLDDAALRARLRAVNESVLPELSRAMWRSVLDAVTGRLESPGAAPATAAGGLAAATEVLRANERAFEDGSASWKTLLGGESFAFGLGAGGDRASGGPRAVFWAAGDWRNLARKEGALDWSGDLYAAHFGVDVGPGRDLQGGLAASRFSSEIDYTDRSAAAAVEGVHESRMTVLTPWLGWDAGDGTRVWTAAGYGRGEIEIVDADLPAGSGRQLADSRLLGVAAGGAKRLWSEGALTVDVKGSAEATHHEVEGNGDEIAGLSVGTRRLRLAAQGARVYELVCGVLTPMVEAGVRYDGGDGATGAGVEVGGGVSWTNPAWGLTVEARSRALVAHHRNVDDWGASGALRLDPGADGRGLSFRLRSSWGEPGAARRWEEGAAFPARTDDGRRPGARRMESELGYGLPVFAGAGTAAPYTGLAFARGGEREARIGARLGLRAGLALDLRASRARARSGALAHGIVLRAVARW